MTRKLVALAALSAAGAAHAQSPDRYGPALHAASAGEPIQAAAAVAPPPLRQLSWPGKSSATASTPQRPILSAPGRVAAGPPVGRVTLPAPQPPAYARAELGLAPAAAPPTPYVPAYPTAGAGAPPPSAPAAAILAAARPASTARLYSVHREYGMQPDPVPVPPQFFGPTADLSTPETPDPALVNRRNTAATRAAATTTTPAGEGAPS